jgi:ferredoxin-NADP reductase
VFNYYKDYWFELAYVQRCDDLRHPRILFYAYNHLLGRTECTVPDAQPEVDLDLVVAGRHLAADGVLTLDLADASGADLPAWRPGAHVDLRFGPDLVRQFSLCGDPAVRSTWRFGILREPDGRGGSAAAHALAVGDRIEARGPRNNFALVAAQSYLFIAGGIGITPIVPMIAAAEAAGADWRLLYGGRSRSSMAFRDELSDYGAARVQICPQDETGLLDLRAALAARPLDTQVYCCGPGPLLDAVEALCADRPDTLHVERFAPREVAAPVRADSFEIELRRSGLLLTVPPDRSVLDVISDAGVDVPSSCTEGTCGTCETVLLDGIADHRDSLMTAAEQAANETMMICVSRAVSSRLVLDI